MTRTEFLKSIGLGGAALMAILTACQKNNEITLNTSSNTTTTNGNIDFTLDLTQSTNAALNTNGGYIVVDEVVIARTSTGTYVAATHTCSHEARQNVLFQSDIFYCDVHGARFSTAGKGLNSYGSNGLTIYKTELSGNSLRIYA